MSAQSIANHSKPSCDLGLTSHELVRQTIGQGYGAEYISIIKPYKTAIVISTCRAQSPNGSAITHRQRDHSNWCLSFDNESLKRLAKELQGCAEDNCCYMFRDFGYQYFAGSNTKPAAS